jgi:yecA family protein
MRTKFSPSFATLLQNTAHYPEALGPVVLHGFLTAIAIGPEEVDDYSMLEIIYGVKPSQETFEALSHPVWAALDEILGALLDFDFEPLLVDKDRNPEPNRWMHGFNQAVQLAEEEWRQLNEENLEAGKKYAFLQTLAGPQQAELILDIPPDQYPAYVEESLPYLPNALEVLNRDYWGEPEEYLDDLSLDDLPSFDPAELQWQTDDELIGIILMLGDMVPLEVVEEAIGRGQPVAARMRQHLETNQNWAEDVESEDWWGLLHAIFILGALTGEDAIEGLVHAIQRMDRERDNDLWDWIAGYWPALFRNKRAEASQALRAIASDRSLDWYPRSTAQECLLEAARAAGPEALNEMLRRIAQTVADQAEDWDYRLSLSHQLLSFPRESHRQTLQQLAIEQEEKHEPHPHYDLDYLTETYAKGQERPEWERFEDPLEFYDPMNILNRQIRWAEEDEKRMQDPGLFEDSFDLPYDYEPQTPYVRDAPKVGRNDPCPCGSGKKYKKCCLKKLH